MKRIKTLLATACIAMLALGCASDKQGGAPKLISHPTPPDHARTATVHFPLTTAHTSAENSLAVSGFNITKSDETFMEAERPVHSGLFITSGGEVCRIWLNSVSPGETEIKVDSNKAYTIKGGLIGKMAQKEWDSTVLAEILRDLNK